MSKEKQFKCLSSLGITSLGEENEPRIAGLSLGNSIDEESESQFTKQISMISPPMQFKEQQQGAKKFTRSVSVCDPNNKAAAEKRKRNSSYSENNDEDRISGKMVEKRGKNPEFLSNPSQALRKLFNDDDELLLNVDLLRHPVLNFVLQFVDLESLKMAMTLSVRKAACR